MIRFSGNPVGQLIEFEFPDDVYLKYSSSTGTGKITGTLEDSYVTKVLSPVIDRGEVILIPESNIIKILQTSRKKKNSKIKLKRKIVKKPNKK